MLLKERLIELLTEKRAVAKADLDKIIEMHRNGKGTLSDLMVRENLLNENELTMLLSTELNFPVLNLNLYTVEPDVLKLIPRKLAIRCGVIPVARIGKVLTLAMCDPLNVLALDEIQEITRCIARPIICTTNVIHDALEKYYAEVQEIDSLFEENGDDLEVVKEGSEAPKDGDVKSAGQEAPVIRMVDLFLVEAIKRRASDIHLELFEKALRVRYRIDGQLVQAYLPPPKMHGALMTRLKILSGMDITEHRKPQDGRFKTKLSSKEVDVRVSVLPMIHGEKCVMRILDKSNLTLGLGDLGFLPESLVALERAITKPYGMIIVTGPTGSGKSTTLYTIMNRLNTPDKNIMTIEDPIEYQVDGITQTQVSPDIGLTFSEGLRSLLRQSPDIILIGEIRDNETADIAAKAALTGHLVFSTLHTNSAAGAVTRLLDMGVEPFLIASSVVLFAAQRLCRKICPHCKEEREIPREAVQRFHIDLEQVRHAKSYYGKGCNRCRQTGFHGRLAVLEVLEPDDEIRQMIVDRKSSNEIQQEAQRKGMKLLFENAFEKFRQGETTLEEVFRISSL